MQEKELQCGTRSCEQRLDEIYWNTLWEQSKTGWDLGLPSPPIENFFLHFENKNARILIPGCGNAHEAEFLIKAGFRDITILDIAPKAVEILQEKYKKNTEVKVICEDFFLHEGMYDLVVEQTFFCAIPTILRNDYAKKTASLLSENGFLVGLLFNTIFEKPGPPFGGTSAEYHFTFKKYFEILKMENSYNSIESRKGKEFFIHLKKK